uniref:Uncharacterized protein n=1 Tax=Oryza punctata TaxID=4537 RepID=A0A0E0MNS8_ORYPU
MDTRDRDAGGEDAVVSGDSRGCEGASGEQDAGPLALSGERGRREEASAAAAAGEEADASPPPAIAGDSGVLAEGGEGGGGYVTPTSPRHRLQAPEVCPPAPRARSAPMPMPARRLRRELVMREMAASASPPGRKRIQANRDPDKVVDAFMRGLRRRLLPPEDEKKNPM